ncbi:hypothetical protein JTE88_04050 [Arcanobacterium phocisimile]|uniref:Uncharacterized protein n=1 Tax=Arcanobacterium phocisimile TaxID=1302235 RepID=A0ABX7IIG6_9ACTO|nr:hypothetical protein [Arcanobacterium phocisimile]QRV02902.1 hypothetical protein JTE88_04050 [Arcanobacterium phocisimile]
MISIRCGAETICWKMVNNSVDLPGVIKDLVGSLKGSRYAGNGSLLWGGGDLRW